MNTNHYWDANVPSGFESLVIVLQWVLASVLVTGPLIAGFVPVGTTAWFASLLTVTAMVLVMVAARCASLNCR
jgi:hypothetical protein